MKCGYKVKIDSKKPKNNSEKVSIITPTKEPWIITPHRNRQPANYHLR